MTAFSRCIRLLIALAATAFTFACATEPRAPEPLTSNDFAHFDLLECIGVPYVDQVEVHIRTIEEESILPGRLLVVAERVELGSGAGFQAILGRPYLNLYLTTMLRSQQDGSLLPTERYLVVEVWWVYPRVDQKVCHQWTIYEDDIGKVPTRATLRAMLEDMNGRFVQDKWVLLGDEGVLKLSSYYENVKEYLFEGLQQ